jgi:hypothetical protein
MPFVFQTYINHNYSFIFRFYFSLEFDLMNSINNKNLSISSTRFTVQEFSLKQLFLSGNIPFVIQKEFSFPNRSYIVDFFLADKLLLECSFTQSSQYDGVFRQKATLLESKAAFIKQFFSYPMCVLFESTHSIGDKLFATLMSLMPSVDYFFTSRFELLEFLPLIFQNTCLSEGVTSSGCLSSDNYYHKKSFQNQQVSLKTSKVPFNSKVVPITSFHYLNHQLSNSQLFLSSNLSNIGQEKFSLGLNKHSTENYSIFGVSNYSMEDGIL